MISLESLSIGYSRTVALLKDVNLTAERGEMVALIGRNGAGKSTLLKTILGLIPMIEGSCFLDGNPVGGYNPRTRARKVSFVSSQVSQLPAITVRELVSLGRMPHTGWFGRYGDSDRRQIDHAVEEVNLVHLLDRKLDQLSDGEKQRAMIARAFVQDTPLMVLDEPAAFLDIPNKFDLIRILSRIRESGKTIIYSTHDLESALIKADKLWVIHRGAILEGAPEDLGISGLFDTLFTGSGISFNQRERKFRFDRDVKGEVGLRGNDTTALNWTRNAIERLGFTETGKASTVNIEVELTDGVYRWIISRNGKQFSFGNIYMMARFLTQED